MLDSPAISVVMSVYNAEKYLSESIDSILNQTFSDFEFVIIDDGSTDGSKEILDQYAASDARIKLISRENKGLIYSLNEGIKKSKAPYISRMDADDICSPERLQVQLDYLHNHNDVVAVGSSVLFIDSDGDPLTKVTVKTTHQELDRQHIKGIGGGIIHPSAMIRKAALEAVELYGSDCLHAEDLDLWLKLAEVGALANIDQALIKYRQHPESICRTKRQEQIESTKKAVELACVRRGMEFRASELHTMHRDTSPYVLHLTWAWWAYKGSNKRVSRKHAVKAFFNAPWRMEPLKILLLNIIK